MMQEACAPESRRRILGEVPSLLQAGAEKTLSLPGVIDPAMFANIAMVLTGGIGEVSVRESAEGSEVDGEVPL